MEFLKSLYHNYKLLKKYQHLLQGGMYVIHPNLRSYVKLGNKKNPYLPSGDSGRKWLFMYITSFLFTRLVIKGKKDGFEFVYFSNMPEVDYRDIKMFSIRNAKVLTICQSKRRYERIIAKKEFVGCYFPLPNWREIKGLQDLCLEEELIELQNRQKIIKKDYLLKLVSFYVNYFSVVKNDVRYCKDGLYYQHGDLSIDNVFVNRDGELLFIDFDHSDYLPAFYDVFYQIVNNYIKNDDAAAIDLLRDSNVIRLIEKFEQKSALFYFQAYINTFLMRPFVPMSESVRLQYSDIFDKIRKILSNELN